MKVIKHYNGWSADSQEDVEIDVCPIETKMAIVMIVCTEGVTR